MLVIKPLDKNVIYSFLCSFKDIDLTDKLACQRIVDMFINKVILYDEYCEIYFNTNGDKSKQLKLKEQPDIDSEFLFESKKKEQSKLKSSDYSLMAENTGFEPADALTSTVFKTAALNHSANSPHFVLRRSKNRCNGLPKRDAWFILSFLSGQRVREVRRLFDLFGTSLQDRRFKPLDGFPRLFLRRSENRCNGLPKQDAWFDIKFLLGHF